MFLNLQVVDEGTRRWCVGTKTKAAHDFGIYRNTVARLLQTRALGVARAKSKRPDRAACSSDSLDPWINAPMTDQRLLWLVYLRVHYHDAVQCNVAKSQHKA